MNIGKTEFLTRFITIPQIRNGLREIFPTPSGPQPRPISVPAISGNASLIGIAFDYLIKLILKARFERTDGDLWQTLEKVLSRVERLEMDFASPIHRTMQYYRDIKVLSPDKQLSDLIRDVILMARATADELRRCGEVKDDLLESCIKISQIDGIFKGHGWFPKSLGNVVRQQVRELRMLCNALNDSWMAPKFYCNIKCDFPNANTIAKGEPDLVIDQMLIDIKTVRDLKLRRSYFDQLLGYYCLSLIERVLYGSGEHTISELCIYYSRYGYLHRIPIRTLSMEEKASKLIGLFLMHGDSIPVLNRSKHE